MVVDNLPNEEGGEDAHGLVAKERLRGENLPGAGEVLRNGLEEDLYG